MTPEKRPPQELGTGYKYVSLGISFGLGIVLFMGLGFFLDRWLKLSPVFTVVGTLVGAVVSFFWVYTKLRADEKQYEAEHPHKYDRRE
jgi:F0F1-type ATP synthase assembly protein I